MQANNGEVVESWKGEEVERTVQGREWQRTE